jgi:hypothetical protein
MAQKRKRAELVWEHLWRERIDAWSGSGQTQRRFCQAHGISVSSFSRWKVELARRDELGAAIAPAGKMAPSGDSSERTSEALRWTEVRLPGAGADMGGVDGAGFEVVLPRGWSVRLGPRFETEPLRRLLAVLEERSC